MLDEFIRVVTNSKRAIGEFSKQILYKSPLLHNNNNKTSNSNTGEEDEEEYYGEYYSEHSSSQSQTQQLQTKKISTFQKWFPRTYNLINSYASYSNLNSSSDTNVQYFQLHFHRANYAMTSVNIMAMLMCCLYWISFIVGICCRNSCCCGVKHFILFNIIILVLLTVIFGLNFTINMALADFCLNAKPVITDITVYRITSNNFTTKFVNYYLYCHLNQLNLAQHKNTVIDFLDQFSSQFNTVLSNSSSWMLSGLVSNVKSGIEHTYDTLHCVEVNRLINKGLTEFCTKPVDGMAIITISLGFSLFLFVIILFMFTFML